MAALAEAQPLDGRRRWHDGPRALGGRTQRDPLHLLDRQDLAPPSDERRQRQDGADDGDDQVCDEPGAAERDAKCQDHGPGGRRGQLDDLGLRLRAHAARLSHQRPIT